MAAFEVIENVKLGLSGANVNTSVGACIALAAVGLLVCHQISTENAVVLLGIAGTWVGINARDAGNKGDKQ